MGYLIYQFLLELKIIQRITHCRGGGDLFTIDLGTPASGFELNDILISNGAIIEAFTAPDGIEGAREVHLRVEFPTHPGEGTFSIMFPAGSMTLFDDTSVENAAFTMTIFYDLAIIAPPPPDPPTPPDPNADAVATLSIVESTIAAGSAVTVNVGFDKTVTGFDISDLTTTGGVLSNFQGFDSENYTATLTLPASGSGTVTVTLAADSVVPGNNLAADSISYFTPAPVTPPSVGAAIYINPSTQVLPNVGETFTVEIKVRGVENYTSSGFSVIFDNLSIEYVSYQEGVVFHSQTRHVLYPNNLNYNEVGSKYHWYRP